MTLFSGRVNMEMRRLHRQQSQLITLMHRRCHIVSVSGPQHAPTFTAETSLYGQVCTELTVRNTQANNPNHITEQARLDFRPEDLGLADLKT